MKFIAVFLALSALAPMSAQTTGTEATIHKEDQHTIPKSDHTFTGNLTLASQYVFRGLTQTDGKPALQGGFDYSHANGLYLGTWFSNISWYTDQNAGVASAPVALASPCSVGAPYVLGKQNSANLEWDLYAGFKKSFANDWSLDVGAVVYYYPGIYANTGAYRQPHTTEVYGQIGYAWMSLEFSQALGGGISSACMNPFGWGMWTFPPPSHCVTASTSSRCTSAISATRDAPIQAIGELPEETTASSPTPTTSLV